MGLTLSRRDLNFCVHGTPPQKQVDDKGEGGGREGLWEEREERESFTVITPRCIFISSLGPKHSTISSGRPHGTDRGRERWWGQRGGAREGERQMEKEREREEEEEEDRQTDRQTDRRRRRRRRQTEVLGI